MKKEACRMSIKSTCLSLLLLILFSPYAYSEVDEIDSLRSFWKEESNDDLQRFLALDKLIYLHKNLNLDTVLFYAKLEYEFGVQNNITEVKAMALSCIGTVHHLKGGLDDALKYYLASIKLRKDKGQLDKAVGVYNNVGAVYKRLERFELALECYYQVLDIHIENNDTASMIPVLINIGQINNELGEREASFAYLRRSLFLANNSKDDDARIIALYHLGVMHSKDADSLSLFYLKESNRIATERGNLRMQVKSLFSLGELFKERGDYDHALRYMKKAMVFTEDLASPRYEVSIAERLYEIYRIRDMYDSSLFMYEKYIRMNDSIDEKSAKQNILDLEQRHLLREKSIADSLSFAQQLEISQKNEETRNIIMAASVLFLLVIIVVYFKIKRVKYKTEKEKLLQKIQLLKAEMLVSEKARSTKTELMEAELNRSMINSNVLFPLNDSDWKILIALFENPNINNREIAEIVFLSIEGVRSSLKKMYRLFDVQKSEGPQRINLLVKATQASMEK